MDKRTQDAVYKDITSMEAVELVCSSKELFYMVKYTEAFE